MKNQKFIFIVFLFVFNSSSYTQIYRPLNSSFYLFNKDLSGEDIITKIDSEKANSNRDINLLLSLNGAFRETANLKDVDADKLNGSVSATFIQEDAWQLTVGYTLNKVKDNVITSGKQFYNSIILPDFGGQSFSLDGSLFYKQSRRGINVNLSLGNDVWIIDSLSYLASPLLVKVNYFWRPLANYKIDNENLFDLSINLGLTSRLLTNSIAKKEAELQSKFGLNNRLLMGLEGGVYFSFNSLTLFFNPILIFGDVDSDDFPGHGIYLLGAIVNGDAFRFKLKRK